MKLEKMFIQPRRRLSRLLGVSPTTAYRMIQRLIKNKEIKSWYSPGLPSLYIKKGE